MSWQSKRTMTADEFKAAIGRLGLNIAAAGRFLGTSERKARRLVAGKAIVDTPTALLLRLMARHREVPEVPPWRRDAN